MRLPSPVTDGSDDGRAQQLADLVTPWRRLIKFAAEEDGLEHLGEPCEPDLDGEEGYCAQLNTHSWIGRR